MRGRAVAAVEELGIEAMAAAEEVGVEVVAKESGGVESGRDLESFGMKAKRRRVGYYL
jgi:hypothetical protein